MYKIREALRTNGLYTLVIEDIDEVDGVNQVIATYRVARIFDFSTKQDDVQIMNYNTMKPVAEDLKIKLTKILEFIEGGFTDELSGL